MTNSDALDRIYVIDDSVPMPFRQELYSRLLSVNWKYEGVSASLLENSRTLNFVMKNFKDTPDKDPNAFLQRYLETLWKQHIGPLVSQMFHYSPQQIGLHHVYGNFSAWGDHSPIHQDISPTGNKKMITAIFYPNIEWSPEWGAETIFVNDEKTDIIRSVLPKPGRVLLFDGAYYHAMRPPTRMAPIPRMSLAYKIEIIDNVNTNNAKH